MSTQQLIRSESNDRRGSLAARRHKAHDLRYDNIARVLIDLDEHVHVPVKPKRERKPVADHAALMELRAQVAILKSENDRFAERFVEELDGLADRLAELEAQMRWPWWWRALAHARDATEVAERRREKARARLKSLFLHRMDRKHRPA
jgi:hypothetical protein